MRAGRAPGLWASTGSSSDTEHTLLRPRGFSAAVQGHGESPLSVLKALLLGAPRPRTVRSFPLVRMFPRAETMELSWPRDAHLCPLAALWALVFASTSRSAGGSLSSPGLGLRELCFGKPPPGLETHPPSACPRTLSKHSGGAWPWGWTGQAGCGERDRAPHGASQQRGLL